MNRMFSRLSWSWLFAFGVLIVWITALQTGCGSSSDPIQKLTRQYKNVPTYSIVLEDMKQEGNFFKDYFHKYRIITPAKAESSESSDWMDVSSDVKMTTTDWIQVPSGFFDHHLPHLGMTIYLKKEGQGFDAAGPPGYEYVGNQRYGQWRQDSRGGSFWEFYGKYALLSHLLGPGPIYRNHWNSYNTAFRAKKPYYGPNNRYGTNGAFTRTQKTDFFSRRQSADLTKRSSFSKKVNTRIGRTKSSYRGRSGGSGK